MASFQQHRRRRPRIRIRIACPCRSYPCNALPIRTTRFRGSARGAELVLWYRRGPRPEVWNRPMAGLQQHRRRRIRIRSRIARLCPSYPLNAPSMRTTRFRRRFPSEVPISRIIRVTLPKQPSNPPSHSFPARIRQNPPVRAPSRPRYPTGGIIPVAARIGAPDTLPRRTTPVLSPRFPERPREPLHRPVDLMRVHFDSTGAPKKRSSRTAPNRAPILEPLEKLYYRRERKISTHTDAHLAPLEIRFTRRDHPGMLFATGGER